MKREKTLLAKQGQACVSQEWPNQLESLISSVGPRTVRASVREMKESRRQEQGCSCMQGPVRDEVCRYVDYV